MRPIEKLTAAAHALKSGDYDNANIAVRSNDEVGQLARTFNVMIDVLRQRERERDGAARVALGYEKDEPMARSAKAEAAGARAAPRSGLGAADPGPPPRPQDVGRVHGARQAHHRALRRPVRPAPLRLPPSGAPAEVRAALPQALSGQGRLHRLGRARRTRSWCACGGVANTAMRFNYLAADLESRLPRHLHGLGGPRALGLDGGRARLLARDLRRAAAPADRRTSAAAR